MEPRIPIPGSDKTLGGDEIFIIADIGKNFITSEDDRPVEEYLANAKALVLAAKDAGVNAVKFQTHEVEDEVLNIDFTSPHFKARDRYSWVKRNTNATPIESFWKPLKAFCDEQGILFFSTPMSRKAAQKLDSVGVPLWKISSGDVQDNVLLEYVAESGKPVIISSGMVSLDELDVIVAHLSAKKVPLSILYCISQYPAPKESFNIATIELFREKYPNAIIGFSDHSLTHDASLAAMKAGARIIEKHFSFSRDLWGADHKASLTPKEFSELVRMAKEGLYREVEIGDFYGSKNKELEGATNQYRPFFNKSLVAAREIAPGEILSIDSVFAMRPLKLAGGLPAHHLLQVIGKTAKKGFKKFDPINHDSLS